MARPIYYVPYANCTPDEPRPGWYLGEERSHDIPDDHPIGPFGTAEEAWEAYDEMDNEDLTDSITKGHYP